MVKGDSAVEIKALTKFSKEAVISRLGAGDALLLLGNSIDKRIMDRFGFKEWRSIFLVAYYGKDEELVFSSFAKLREKAVSFQDVAFVYACEQDDIEAGRMFSHLLTNGTSIDWLNLYADVDDLRPYTKIERVAALKERAAEVIKQAVKS